MCDTEADKGQKVLTDYFAANVSLDLFRRCYRRPSVMQAYVANSSLLVCHVMAFLLISKDRK
jgi:hypothetical protein